MRALALGSFLVLASLPALAGAQTRGWSELALPSGGRATRYLPASVRTCEPSPLAVFLHGAGGTPEAYHPHLEAPAETLGLVLVLPQASGAGWASADVTTIVQAIEAVEAELVVDGQRTYFAGHSAGGAFAYLLTYEGSEGVAAVFSMSAPFYAIAARSDARHAAPIRMYYGADDPNYTGGAAGALEAQWARLGVPFVTDVQPGFGHSSWPPSSIQAGFEHLLAVRYPGPATPSRCADADGGPPSLDGGAPPDAGAHDAAQPSDGGARDASRGHDASGGRSFVASGCGCRVGPRSTDARALLLALAVVAIIASRRWRRRSER